MPILWWERLLWAFLIATAPVFAAVPGILRVRVFDSNHTIPVPARVNVIGADNAFYEPDPGKNALSEYSLKRKGNRASVGPLRYYGSFLLHRGEHFEVKLPPGPARIEVRKGYGYYAAIAEADVATGKTTDTAIVLQRVIDMPRYGWHSMDTHLHFDRMDVETTTASPNCLPPKTLNWDTFWPPAQEKASAWRRSIPSPPTRWPPDAKPPVRAWAM